MEGAIKGAKAGFDKTRADGFDQALGSAAKGNIWGVLKGYASAVNKNEATPELVNDPRYATDETRSANEPSLRAALEGWTLQHDVADVVARLDAAGVPVAPIWNIEQALDSPQIQARGLLRPVDDERLPDLRLPTQPVHFNGCAPNRAVRAPALGEHTDLLLSSWLGRSSEAIAALREAGVLGTAEAAQH